MALFPIHPSTGTVSPTEKVGPSAPKAPRRLRSASVPLARMDRRRDAPAAHLIASKTPRMLKLVSARALALHTRKRKKQELKEALAALDACLLKPAPQDEPVGKVLAKLAHLMISLGMSSLAPGQATTRRQRLAISGLASIGGLSVEQLAFLEALYPAQADSLDDSPHARGIPDAIAPHKSDPSHIAVSDAP